LHHTYIASLFFSFLSNFCEAFSSSSPFRHKSRLLTRASDQTAKGLHNYIEGSMSNNLKQRRELGEQMRQVEAKIGKLNTDLNSLKTNPVDGSLVVTCSVTGFEEEGRALKLSVDPDSLCGSGMSSSTESSCQFVVSSTAGSLKATVVSSDGSAEKELGSWPLGPIDAEVCLNAEAEVQSFLKITATVTPRESVASDITGKEAEVEELYRTRKHIKSQMAELQKEAAEAAQQTAADSGSKPKAGASGTSLAKSLVWSKLLSAPLAVFNLGVFVFNSPLKELVFFGAGVSLLIYRGDDLAV